MFTIHYIGYTGFNIYCGMVMYIFEYSQQKGFFYSLSESHYPNKSRKLLSKSISYYSLRKFIDMMRAIYPEFWTDKPNPKFETIEKHFKKYENDV